MTTTCLLCPAPAVADGLCTPCGADLWWCSIIVTVKPAWMRIDQFVKGVKEGQGDRFAASRRHPTPNDARAFLDRHEAAKAARAAAPLCSRGCKSHDGEEER